MIVFVDEIDAIGRKRSSHIGGNDEREQALNALLVELDGFKERSSVILMAATNRADVLDSALLRPGRFDRHISVMKPDVEGRKRILDIHARNLKIGKTVDLFTIAKQTVGLVGADLANLMNEAALLAAREDKSSVEQVDMMEAFERVVAGLKKKKSLMSPREREIVSYHECGHAVVAALLPEVDPVHKVSIVPRGGAALGYTMQLPEGDRYLRSYKEYLGTICVLLGGRLAEELFFSDVTSGAYDDLQKATAIARNMICSFGMSAEVGMLNWESQPQEGVLVTSKQVYSDKTAEAIDQELRRIVQVCVDKVRKILQEYKGHVEFLAKTLLDKEVLEGDFIVDVVQGKIPIVPMEESEKIESNDENVEVISPALD